MFLMSWNILKSLNILILSRHIIWILIIQLYFIFNQFLQIHSHVPVDIICEYFIIIFFFPIIYITIILCLFNQFMMIEVLWLCDIITIHFPPIAAITVLPEYEVKLGIETLNTHLKKYLPSSMLDNSIC